MVTVDNLKVRGIIGFLVDLFISAIFVKGKIDSFHNLTNVFRLFIVKFSRLSSTPENLFKGKDSKRSSFIIVSSQHQISLSSDCIESTVETASYLSHCPHRSLE
jgi:hypothetical protein